MRAGNDPIAATNKRRTYRCFLVRCRLEEAAGSEGEAAWRFTVEQAGRDGARCSFTSLHEVATYMETELASCGGSTRGKPNKP